MGNKNTTFRKPSIEEYRALKEEINHNRWKQAQVFTYALIVSGALLGYFLAAEAPYEMPYLFLSPLAILIPSILIVISLANANNRISIYIRVFHEGLENGLMYESIVTDYFKWPKAPIVIRYVAVYKAMVYANTSLAFVSVALSFVFATPSVNIPTMLVAGLGLMLTSFCLFYLFMCEKKYSHAALEEAWKIAKERWENEVRKHSGASK